jgi:hypothetical protein
VLALLALTSCFGVVGCGGDDGGSGDLPGATTEDEPSPGDEQLPTPPVIGAGANDLAISSGELTLSAGHALLKFIENISDVSLDIIGSSAEGDSIFLSLTFPRSAEVFGPHTNPLALPGESGNVAHVLFGSAPETYHYSRSGEVDLTLAREGHQLSGTFSIDVIEATESSDGEFEAVGEPLPLTGSFTGAYEVLCYSALPGHSLALTPGGDFCDAVGL